MEADIKESYIQVKRICRPHSLQKRGLVQQEYQDQMEEMSPHKWNARHKVARCDLCLAGFWTYLNLIFCFLTLPLWEWIFILYLCLLEVFHFISVYTVAYRDWLHSLKMFQIFKLKFIRSLEVGVNVLWCEGELLRTMSWFKWGIFPTGSYP